MKGKQLVLILLVFALFIPFSTALGVTIETPEANKVYTHATAIPLDLTFTSSGESVTCSYSLDFGVTNTTIDCVDMGLDVPITNSTDETETKPVNLMYWAENETLDEVVATVDFFIYSNITEAKAIILIGVIGLVLVLGMFFMVYALKLEEDLAGLKLLLMGLSFVAILVSIHLGNLAIREYLRFSPFMEAYDRLYFIATIFIIVIFVYVLIMMFLKATKMVKVKGAGGGL